LSGAPLAAWAKVVKRLQVREVSQPADTFFGPDKVSSRIDRVYTSYTEADQTLFSLEAFVIARPHLGPGTAPGPVGAGRDHYPLVFHPVSTEARLAAATMSLAGCSTSAPS
jgi:hypothetical protein